MPTTRRSRTLKATPHDVWRVVGDAHHLPRWWPRCERVEAVEGRAFTQVLKSDRGRMVRADFRVLETRDHERRRWAQDVDGTPFERVLASAETQVDLAPAGDGTKVTLTVEQELKGVSRFGGFLVRRATKKILDEALDGLQRVVA